MTRPELEPGLLNPEFSALIYRAPRLLSSNNPEYSEFTFFISTEKITISRTLIIHVQFNYNLFCLLSDYRIMVGTEIKTVQLSLFSMLPYLEDVVM